MKFESKFGIGEIVLTHIKGRDDRRVGDDLLEITAVIFGADRNAPPCYACRFAGTGYISHFDECQLIGDPAFHQENGYDVDTEENDQE